MDQYENMKRNKEMQQVYKKKLVDDLIKKEQKYFRAKKAKDISVSLQLIPVAPNHSQIFLKWVTQTLGFL